MVGNSVWWSFLNKKMPRLITLCFLMLMAWQAGSWLAKGLEQPLVPAVPDLQPLNVERSVAPKTIALWGDVPAERAGEVTQVESDESESEVRATGLNLKLLGVIDSEPVGVAIIQTGREVKVLAVGESLRLNVTLHEIKGDYVILLNRNQRERLAMEDQVEGLVVTSEDVTHDVEAVTEQLLTVSEEIRQNPMRIGQYVRFEPLREQNEWLGIRIGARNQPEIFHALGFQEGDMVISINGLTLADMADNPAIWNQFLQESRFSLVVNRDGLEQTIDVDLQK